MVKKLMLEVAVNRWQVVLSVRSRTEEVMTKLTTMPDLLAPDSTAQACLGASVALPEVSSINKPGGREGCDSLGSE